MLLLEVSLAAKVAAPVTSTLGARLAQRTGVAVICGIAHRLPDAQGFELRFEHASDSVAVADPETAARAINAAVERSVRHAAAQYQWEYKRFKRRPAGQRDYYK